MTLSKNTAIPLLVAGAFFMEMLDGTVIVTALPQMGEAFRVAPVDLNIGVSAYLLTLAVLIPASGWAADRFGARRVFAAAIAVFTLASVLCGICDSLWAFALARVLQGVGGAMMVPVGRLAVLRTTPKHDMIRAIAVITWPGLVAPVLGPPIGGFLTTYASWRWIFFLNIPLGALAFVLALRLIPSGERDREKPFDAIGFVLVGAACFFTMYGLDLFSQIGASGYPAGACVIVGLGLGMLAVHRAGRTRHPLVDFSALQFRSYATTIVGGSLFRIAIGSIPFLLPLLFQVAFGLTAFQSGLLVLAVFAGNLVMKPFTTLILRRFSFRTILLVNGLINAATILACALLTPATPVAVIVALLFVSGLSRSMQFTALNTLAFADVPAAKMSGANTLFNMAQQLSMGMGIGVGAIALRAGGLLVVGASSSLSLPAFHVAFVAVGVIAVVAVFDVIGLAPVAGDEIRLGRKA
jgi:EmrB/QacA subfamily drug resistance transporter